MKNKQEILKKIYYKRALRKNLKKFFEDRANHHEPFYDYRKRKQEWTLRTSMLDPLMEMIVETLEIKQQALQL